VFSDVGGTGCLLSYGSADKPWSASLLDDAVDITVAPLSTPDTGCMGAPMLFSVSPPYGDATGGQASTLTGWGFAQGATIYFGGNKATLATYASSTTYAGVLVPPAAAARTVDVKLVNPDGSQAILPNGYHYTYDPVMFTVSNFPTGDMLHEFAITQNGPSQDIIVYSSGGGNLTDIPVVVSGVPTPHSYKYSQDPSPTNIAFLDIDGDGNQDVVVGLPVSQGVSVRRNDGMGGYPDAAPNLTSFYATADSPLGVAAADLDGDGKPDVVAVNKSSFSVLRNNGSGGLLTPAVTVPTGILSPLADAVGLFDFNGDSHLDVAIADSGSMSPSVTVFYNNGNGSFSSNGVSLNLSGQASTLVSSDINGDGITDLVVPQEAVSKVLLLLGGNQGTSDGQLVLDVPGGPRKLAVGDVNGDGQADLLILKPTTRLIDVFLHQRGAMPTSQLYPAAPSLSIPLTPTDASWISVTDFPPADGKLDAVVATSSGNLAILQNASK
jgi:hypothetical protein